MLGVCCEILNPINNRTIIKIDTHITLKAEKLVIGYPSKRRQTVVGCSLDFFVHSGELMAIVGINGIGKSTLLRTLCHVQPKLSGLLQIDGTAIERYRDASLAEKISLVLTEPLASKNMTVLELVALGRQPYTNWIGSLTEVDRQKIEEAITLVEIGQLQDKPCFELSDGQLQRALIARALAQDTPLMLLDEPTTHLELYHKAHILKLLKSIAHKTNKTIVFTTHEIDLAIQLCDTILLLDRNTMHFGPPCELIASKAFEQLFPKDTIQFDAVTGTFRVIK